MNKLYGYNLHFRGGCIEGVFVSNDEEMKRIYGKELYLGEVLGKHSELTINLDAEDFTVLSEDQEFIEKFEQYVGSIGYVPFDYMPEQEDEDEE